MMGLPSREELGAKLLDYPLLRQLLFERWFRIAFALFVCVFVFFGLFLPKIWRTSPANFRPVIKVSGLDLVQAWSLKRTALKAGAKGDFDEANYAWQSAIANNRADPDLLRGALRNVLKEPHRRQRANQGVQEALWLLRLTGTNIVDLELAARVLDQFRYHDIVISLTEPRVKELTPGLAGLYLKALFEQGRVGVFEKRWNTLGPLVDKDPELALYRAAYLVGWGPPDTVTAARKQIEAATENAGLRLVAYRLKLVLSAREMNTREYGQTLRKLEDWREDTLNNYIGYWRLLAANGEKAEAVRLAQAHTDPPASPIEVVELAQVYSELDLRPMGLQLYQRYVKDFGHAPIFWVGYANALVDAKQWEDLRKVALQIRSEEGTRDQLSGFSYFLEGRAELALGRKANAVAAFEQAANRDFTYPALGEKVAAQLVQFGQADLARAVLMRLEKTLQDDPRYWVVLFSVADQLKDVDLLVKAGRRAYELNPNDPAVMNNYAAALIISRQDPQEAIKVTLPFLSQNPNSLHAVVNHSAALLLNDRPKEAEALLDRVRTNNLTADQLALYNFDLFETYVGLRQFDRAWKISDRIEAARLYPTQRRWLEQTLQGLPPRPKSGEASSSG
jgi:tetratricopeptide (TPR) repeat protein